MVGMKTKRPTGLLAVMGKMIIVVIALIIAQCITAVVGQTTHYLQWSPETNFLEWDRNNTIYLNDIIVITNNTPDGFLLVNALHQINCNTSEPFSVETGGVTVISLTDTQTRFIISERADLCRDGLKWQVNARDPVQEANEAP